MKFRMTYLDGTAAEQVMTWPEFRVVYLSATHDNRRLRSIESLEVGEGGKPPSKVTFEVPAGD